MKLYKISQDINEGWDTYDSAVVCAESEEDARKIHPQSDWEHETKIYGRVWVPFEERHKLKVEYIGEAIDGLERGIIVGSFNAG